MNLLNEILVDVDFRCIKNACAGDGCSLALQDIDPNRYILISMDGCGAPTLQTSTRCDFLFVGHVSDVAGFWVIPVELTRGVNKPISTIVRQLRAGAQVAESLILQGQDLQFTPVAAGPFRKNRRTEIRKSGNEITFRTDSYPIDLAECGDKLTDALTYGTKS